MTEEQIKVWRQHRDIAKQIEDPVQRQLALDKLYEEKDDLMQECFQKQSTRIKNVIANQIEMKDDINQIKGDFITLNDNMEKVNNNILTIGDRLQKNDNVTYKLNEKDIEKRGMKKLLKIIYYIIAAGGSGLLINLIQHFAK